VIGLGLSIVSVLLLEPSLGIGSAALATVVESLVQFLLLLPFLARRGRYRWAFEWGHPGVRQIAQMFSPLTIAAAVDSGDLLVDRVLASGLSEGSIGYLGNAYRLMSRLVTLHVMGISNTMFPLLGKYAAERDGSAFREALSKILRVMLFLVMPSAIGVLLLSRPAVALLLQRGQFTPQDTQAVASVMLLYLGFLFSRILIAPLYRAFYALQDTHRPMIINLICFAVGVGLKLWFVVPWSFRGLALATSVYWLGKVVLGYALLRRKLPDFRMGFTSAFLLRLGGCALSMALVIVGLQQLPWRENWFSLPLLLAGGTGIYILLALRCRLPEAHTVASQLKAAMRRRG
jgi:putative peptidoglycan lipid II flippase